MKIPLVCVPPVVHPCSSAMADSVQGRRNEGHESSVGGPSVGAEGELCYDLPSSTAEGGRVLGCSNAGNVRLGIWPMVLVLNSSNQAVVLQRGHSCRTSAQRYGPKE